MPTEAEGERAARGTTGRIYPWGDAPEDPERLNYRRNVGYPTPVGIYPQGATPEGIEDLAGSVWEWCADWYGGYSHETLRNPRGAERGDVRVLRGGSWLNYEDGARAAFRLNYSPGYRFLGVGFRLVCSSPNSR